MPDQPPIAVTCAACSRKFRVKAKAAGRTVPCPECEQPVRVPLASPGPAAEADVAPPAEAVGEPSGQDESLAGFLAGLDPSPQRASPPPPPEPAARAEATEHQASESPEVSSGAKATAGVSAAPVAIPRKTVAFEPRKYRALEALRVILYVFAGLMVAGWAVYSATALFAASAVFSSGGSAPQWPAGVSEDASVFDPDLTDDQRSAIAEFEARRSEGAARGTVAAVGILAWITTTLATFLMVVGFCSYAELIRVAIDVQQNTQFAAYQLAIRN